MTQVPVPLHIEEGEHGLFYGTSPVIPGLLVAGTSPEDVMIKAPRAVAELEQARRSIEEEPLGSDTTTAEK